MLRSVCLALVARWPGWAEPTRSALERVDAWGPRADPLGSPGLALRLVGAHAPPR